MIIGEPLWRRHWTSGLHKPWSEWVNEWVSFIMLLIYYEKTEWQVIYRLTSSSSICNWPCSMRMKRICRKSCNTTSEELCIIQLIKFYFEIKFNFELYFLVLWFPFSYLVFYMLFDRCFCIYLITCLNWCLILASLKFCDSHVMKIVTRCFIFWCMLFVR